MCSMLRNQRRLHQATTVHVFALAEIDGSDSDESGSDSRPATGVAGALFVPSQKGWKCRMHRGARRRRAMRLERALW